ncbi:alpha/beta fold hydrolase [Ideonella sp. A 288]|uniref:alpha/beta fold hydrolase n=1 Tax=Ideonella sp. A 288 TaxID=1962181 RepID=UPI000B4A71D5|nr:alpha/beta hydrolase [Ideonella sp. A 288]
MASALIRLFGILLMVTALAVPLMRAPDRAVETLVARWAPPPSEFIDLQGQLVHYRDEGPRGDAVPLVLLHGTSASLHTWDGWVKALRGQRRVIRLDLPGFGLTGPYAGPYAGRAYTGANDARFVLDVLAALKVQRFAIGGNSLGGEVAWRVALQAPQRVDRLILVDSAGQALAPESVPWAWRLAALPVAGRLIEHLLPRPLVVSGLVDVYGDARRIDDALVDRYFELTLRAGNRHALGQRIEHLRHPEDAALIATLKLPTLILWGGRDRLIPPAIGQRFHRDIAGSTLQVFDALGHVPQEEDPVATVQPVKAFLGLAP